ncbi:MAG: NADH-quinone oxidoreductase subunit F, partial [Bacteroidota bacterium]
MEKLLLPDIDNLRSIDVYEARGGYRALKKALAMKPEEVTDEVKKSNLRGRGGACFPTGLKWTFMPKQSSKPKYLCVNGDEAEPGTFKDRQIFELNPHLLIEGTLIACYAMGITTAYIYIRGEYGKWIAMMEKALADSYRRGYVGEGILGHAFSTNIYIHKGAGAYICGEESALMNSIEGDRGYPRIKPPFPAQYGLWGCPTTINNVETIANVPLIIERGGEWYSKIGAPKHPGPILVGVSGHVHFPGVFELPTGEPII